MRAGADPTMATQPEIAPDVITPQAPPEMPPSPSPAEEPIQQPPGFEPNRPDHDQPDRSIPETPPPPD